MKDHIKQYGELIAILLALFLIIFTLFIRMQSSPAIAGDESYFNLRMSHELVNNYNLEHDELENRTYNFNLYHYFLTLFLFLPDQVMILISILLTLISTYLFYLALRANFNKEKSIIAIIVYILSPLYVYSALTLTSFSLITFLVILSAYLYFKKNKYWMLPALLITLLDISSFIIFTSIVLIYEFQKEQDYEKPFVLLILGALVAFVFMKLMNYTPIFNLNGGLIFKHYITDFGAIIGYSFFSLLLALAIISLWKNNSKNIVANLSIVLLFLYTTLSSSSRIVFNLVISLYVMFALYHFINRKWIMDVLKDLTMLILVSSLLFSSISFANRLANMEPTNEFILTLQTMKENNREGIIFISPENGFITEYYTGKPVYLDGLSFIYSDYEEKLEISQELLDSTSPIKTKELLNKEGITYIHVNSKTREEKKGIVLVLELSENFIKLGEFNGQEAWLYLKI